MNPFRPYYSIVDGPGCGGKVLRHFFLPLWRKVVNGVVVRRWGFSLFVSEPATKSVWDKANGFQFGGPTIGLFGKNWTLI